jgi:hypothetical protein
MASTAGPLWGLFVEVFLGMVAALEDEEDKDAAGPKRETKVDKADEKRTSPSPNKARLPGWMTAGADGAGDKLRALLATTMGSIGGGAEAPSAAGNRPDTAASRGVNETGASSKTATAAKAIRARASTSTTSGSSSAPSNRASMLSAWTAAGDYGSTANLLTPLAPSAAGGRGRSNSNNSNGGGGAAAGLAPLDPRLTRGDPERSRQGPSHERVPAGIAILLPKFLSHLSASILHVTTKVSHFNVAFLNRLYLQPSTVTSPTTIPHAI